VPTETFKGFFDAIGRFLEPTEQFFLARYPSLDVAASTKGPRTEVGNA
jgi:hypothetical protein